MDMKIEGSTRFNRILPNGAWRRCSYSDTSTFVLSGRILSCNRFCVALWTPSHKICEPGAPFAGCCICCHEPHVTSATVQREASAKTATTGSRPDPAARIFVQSSRAPPRRCRHAFCTVVSHP
eukprot:5202922-Alexandrium_andersonii.AAC.1